VFVVKPDSTVEERLVTVGRTVEDQSVITQGLEGTETVVTEGQLRLVPGVKIEVKAAAAGEGGGQAAGMAGPGAPAGQRGSK
jgi:membrane fusion protein, multidrug efflux system